MCVLTTAQFLLFSAMVLMILMNIGMLTDNIVSRNIYYAKMTSPNLGQLLGSLEEKPSTLATVGQNGLGQQGVPQEVRGLPVAD